MKLTNFFDISAYTITYSEWNIRKLSTSLFGLNLKIIGNSE